MLQTTANAIGHHAILTAMLAPALSIEPEVAGKHAAASASSYTIPISPTAIAS